MANERGKHLDKTHLSIDQAEERGFIHRDYIAHCLRWTHVCKHLQQGQLYKRAHILDVGCGKEVPLAKLMYSSRLIPETGTYLGIDANRVNIPDMFHTGKFPIEVVSGVFPEYINAVAMELDEPLTFDVITCFEVLEHVEPEHALSMLRAIRSYLSPSGSAFLSTPCYDKATGAAANHVNEMSYGAFGALIEHAGLHVNANYGTFASIKDYKDELKNWGLEATFEALRQYYDVNYLATILAPLFPGLARNCLWHVNIPKAMQSGAECTSYPRKFPPIKNLHQEENSSSAQWVAFVDSL